MKMKNKRYNIYIHIFPNGKVYIGQTCQTLAQRWMRGKGYKGQLVGRAIDKYGWDNIEHDVLYYDLTKQQADEIEKELIKQYRSNDERFGYNLAEGGETNKVFLPHSKKHYSMVSEVNSKPVDCYDRDGNFIASFQSVNSAAEFVNGSFKVISACCNGKKKSGYKYVWRFKREPFDKYETQNKVGGVKGFPINVYTEDGEYIGSFKNIKAASITTGIRYKRITDICKGKLKSKNQLVFSYAQNEVAT
jgi:hypothetical protein